MDKKKVWHYIWNYFLLTLGSFLLGFGNAIFLTNLSIDSGGLSGVGIIAQYYITNSGSTFQAIDIIVWSLSALFWIISLIFLGKKFAIRTLFASIMFPLFLTLFLRVLIPYVPFFRDFQIAVSGPTGATSEQLIGNYLLCGLFGGVCIGTGVAVSLVGGGSSGGVDVVVVLLDKYLHIKQSIGSLIVDGTVILIGLICMRNYISCLAGILCAVVASLMIEIIYVKRQSSCQADIISEKYEEISRFVQDELGRGTTIITAKGGYKGDSRPMLRVVIDKSQYLKLKDFLAETDPNAFVTFTITKAVYGEGFDNNKKKIISTKNNKKD